MIKLKDLIFEDSEPVDILVPRRGRKDRNKNYQNIIQKQIQNYIKNGSKGDLDLANLPIQTLPDNLTVGGNLYLSASSIQELPDSLSVEGDLYIAGTPLSRKYDTLGQLYKALKPLVKGAINRWDFHKMY